MCFRVLAEGNPVLWDTKSPGSGIDTIVDHFGNEHLAFARFMAKDPKTMEHFKSHSNRDVTTQKITAMASSKYLGSGIQLTSEGWIDVKRDQSWRNQAGMVGFMTEGRKVNASSESSTDMMATIECFIGESGGGSGTQKQGWVSTSNFLRSRSFN